MAYRLDLEEMEGRRVACVSDYTGHIRQVWRALQAGGW
jgi:hypothetical protein